MKHTFRLSLPCVNAIYLEGYLRATKTKLFRPPVLHGTHGERAGERIEDTLSCCRLLGLGLLLYPIA